MFDSLILYAYEVLLDHSIKLVRVFPVICVTLHLH